MSGRSQYKSGALLSYGYTLLSIAQGLVLLPLLTRYLGREQYGFYQWLGSIVSYVVLMDFGLGNAVIRYVAKFRGEGKLGNMESFLGMVMKLYSVIGGVILLLGAVGYWLLPNFLPANLSPEYAAMARPMFALLVFNMTVSMLCNIFPAVMNGFERFAVIKGIALGRLVLRTVVLILMLRRGCSALDIVLLDTIINVLATLVQMALVHFSLKIRFRYEKIDRELLRSVTRYSVFIFLNMLMNEVYWRVDTTIMGFINMSLVVVTTTGGYFPTYMMEFSNAISGLMLPKATRMVVDGASGQELTTLMIRTGRIQLMVVCLLVVGFGFAGMEFVTLWMGATLGDMVWQSYAIALMLMISLVIPLTQCTAISIVQAMDKHAFRAVVLAIISVLNVAISIVLANLWGPIGAAMGTTFSLLVGNVGIINWYYHFKIGLDISRFFRETFHKTLPALLLICAVCCLTLLLPSGGYAMLLLRIVLIAAVYCSLMLAVGMNEEERSLVFGGLRRLTGRRGTA